MLYDRWRQIARERRHDLAVREAQTGEQWTFSDLARMADGAPRAASGFLYPQGHSLGFIVEVLRGWRMGAVICPLESGQRPPALPPPPAPCIHLKTTSATTGAPRAVAFTASQLMADADNIAATMGLRPEWPNLGVISLAHSYGYSNLILPLLLHGVPLILAPSPLPESLRRAAREERALTLPAVPALWRAWHEAGAIPANIKLAISAGAPLPAGLEQAVFAASGLKIHNFYGSTECGGIAFDASVTPRGEDALVGAAVQNVHLSVMAGGCMLVQSAAVGETYWPEPDSTVAKGCFHTNDLAEIIAGRVYLRGRASDLMNVAGRKVSPEVIERALRAHPAIQDSLVFGVPGGKEDRGEIIVAVVVAAGGASQAQLRRHLLERLPAWQVPREWRFVDSLAVNPRGKISRAAWREEYLRARGFPPGQSQSV